MNPINVKIWLLKNKIQQIEIARSLSVSRNLVWKTINGKERNGRVVQWLIDHGCPEKYLDMPQRKAA